MRRCPNSAFVEGGTWVSFKQGGKVEKIYAYSSMAPAVDETATFVAAMIVILEALFLGWIFWSKTQKLSFSELLLVGLPFQVSLILVAASNSLTPLLWGGELVYLATVWVIIQRYEIGTFRVRIAQLLGSVIMGGIIYVIWDEKLKAIILSVSLMSVYLLVIKLGYWNFQRRVQRCLLTQIGNH